MEKKTPNKRKSLANSNATPNKIRKTDSPVSQNLIDKSANKNGNKAKSPSKNQNITPKKQVNDNQTKRKNKDEQLEIALKKSANKIKQNQTNGNKSKSPNKNQNIALKKHVNGNQTSPKKQINDKQTASKKQMNTKQTAPKRNKKSKQEEEDDVEVMDDSDEYNTDNSIEEMNDSDVEEAATDEADSDENAQVDEDESGDENESGDEDDSGEEVEVEEDEESDVDEEETDDELENDEVGDLDGEAEHEEIDEEDNNVNEKEAKNKFSVYVAGLKPDLTMDRIFPGCNIEKVRQLMNSITNSENAIVYFKDKESYKKALANQKVIVDDNKIFVNVDRNTVEFSVAVEGLHPGVDVRDIFNDCNILSVGVSRFPMKVKFVHFADKESMQKALMKSGSVVKGNAITVLLIKEIAEREKNLTLCIHGLKSDVKIEDILEGCNIKFYALRTKYNTHKFNGQVDVIFEDEESVQKALLKHETEYNGSVIKMFRKDCRVTVKGIEENTKVETIFTGCKIHAVELKVNKYTNEFEGAVVNFQDYSSLERAISMEAPPGITIYPPKIHRNNKFGNKSTFIKNKFNNPPYQQTYGNEAKKLLLQELKSQVQKLTEEVYGTSRSRPKPFMKNNTFARRNPRINN